MTISAELVRYAQEVDLSSGKTTHALYFKLNSGRVIRSFLDDSEMGEVIAALSEPVRTPSDAEPPAPQAPPSPTAVPRQRRDLTASPSQMRDMGTHFEYSAQEDVEEMQIDTDGQYAPDAEEPPPPPPPDPTPQRRIGVPRRAPAVLPTPRRTVAMNESGYPIVPASAMGQPIQESPTEELDEDGIASI